MRPSLAIAAVLLLVMPMTCCKLASPRPVQLPVAAQKPVAKAGPVDLTVEIFQQRDLIAFVDGMGAPPPKPLTVPDVIYFIGKHLVFVSAQRKMPDVARHYNIQYGEDICISWRDRDLFASVDNCQMPNTLVAMPRDPLSDDLREVPLDSDDNCTPREKRRRRVDDRERDRVAKEGWQSK